MLEVRDVTVQYGSSDILRHISLDLDDGKIMALLGANGAGKTTLIRAINGAVPIAAGELRISGEPIASLSRREIAKRIAVIAQENETRFPMTVIEFVLAGRYVHGGAFGWESDEDLAEAKASLVECDLGGYSGRLMNRLSGGERQRVVLARALATGAKLLLLDEPTANLDLAHQAMMFRLVRERCAEKGSSAVIITHDLNLAAEFADETVLLKYGAIAARGRPREVLSVKNIEDIFGVKVLLDENPASGKTRVTAIY